MSKMATVMFKGEIKSMSTEERLANLEANISSVKTTLEFHGRAHESIASNINSIDSKVDSILLQMAEKIGEAKATKKIAALISATISLAITLIIAYLQS